MDSNILIQDKDTTLNNNNKRLIWITIIVSVLLHLVVGALVPELNFFNQKPTIAKKKTITLSLKAEIAKPDIVTKSEEKIKHPVELPLPLPEKTLKEQPKELAEIKLPPKENSEPKEQTKPQTKGPATSKKQSKNEELKDMGGNRRKGQLDGKKEASATKKTSENKQQGKQLKEKQPVPTQSQKEVQPSERSSQETAQTPAKDQKQNESALDKTQKQPLEKSAPTPKTAVINRSEFKQKRISISQSSSDTKQPLSNKSNPLFDAINDAKPATTLSKHQIGNLTQLQETGLHEARIGDPLSNFEHKQRRVYNKYLARMTEQVNEHWIEPESDELLMTRVRLYLTIDGFIRDIYIEQSSGNPMFDYEAIRAIKAVKQFEMPNSPAAAGYLTRLTMTVDNYSEPNL